MNNEREIDITSSLATAVNTFRNAMAQQRVATSLPKVKNAMQVALLAAAPHILNEAKPRIIWTAKELDALPVESIVRAENGEAILVSECDLRTTDEETFKSAAEMERYYGAALFPATVIYEPQS